MESCEKSNEESKRKKVAGKQASIGSFSLIIIYFLPAFDLRESGEESCGSVRVSVCRKKCGRCSIRPQGWPGLWGLPFGRLNIEKQI